MEITLQRMATSAKSSYGVLFIDNKQLCFSIEDIHRDVKIENETRIPSGRYRIKYREVLSPKTKQYRGIYDFFTWHLELQEVPNFEYVYIHSGNTHEHTSACILTNFGVRLVNNEYVGIDSRAAFSTIYKKISKALDLEEEVWITVRDEDYFISKF